MTAQDFIPMHFIQVSMNGTEAGTSSDGPSMEEVSVSESMCEATVACPPVPQANSGTLECHMDQVCQCPDQPPVPRDPLSEEPQTVQEDTIDLYVDCHDTDFPSSRENLSQTVAQLESEVVEKDRKISKFKGTVNELADAVARRGRCTRWAPSQIRRSDKAV